ncbi:hypothetical protein ABOM_007986 [Aspergillus bombycis]|uniref:BZIP domain-containing protein n=1 Tax=Aspergillus bombycis TaxID=109264 RepID=A0A1F7ZY57_9EURO|nr:hypothetical protein ABOM_007986 [Aspergillus bombycis]OGM43978.1 hypothetical protein ABOM_007986 [Aspergillus bombycis]
MATKPCHFAKPRQDVSKSSLTLTMRRHTTGASDESSLEPMARHAQNADELDKGEKRRRQNRVNQQAFRQRQRLKKAANLLAESYLQLREAQDSLPSPWLPVSGLDLSSMIVWIQEHNPLIKAGSPCRISDPEVYELLSLLESAAYQSYLRNPSSDHRLTLVKLNVFRAFERNITALGYTRSKLTDDAISRFSVDGPRKADDLSESLLPAGLQPTTLQKRQPHHPWLDFFPFAHLRDALIRHEDTLDDSQLCRDLMGFWTMPTVSDNCMLVWGDPWEPMNWEVTEAFLGKWGFLVRSCPEIIWSSNHWRQERGERRLKWKVSFGS